MGVEVVQVQDKAAEPSAKPPPPLPPVKDVEEPNPHNIAEKVADLVPNEKSSGGSVDRDNVLSRIATEKRMSVIKAWEESEKAKVENKVQKKMAYIDSWENSEKAALEAKLKKKEEELEKKKAKCTEKMKNKAAMIHKKAEEKRAVVTLNLGEECLKAEEMAVKYRVKGHVPKKSFGCF